MDGAVVGVDDEFAIVPVRVFVSADQKFQGEMFEHEIGGGFKFVIGKWTEDGARFGDVLDEKFVGELGEQRRKPGQTEIYRIISQPPEQRRQLSSWVAPASRAATIAPATPPAER
jgi:hypothetical protein